jgi:hypothetical protein
LNFLKYQFRILNIEYNPHLAESEFPQRGYYCMSPSIFREKGYRFYFLSNEEERMHIHVTCEDGEAKFWVEPIVSLASSHGLNPRKLMEIQKVVEERKNEIVKAWRKHFSKR